MRASLRPGIDRERITHRAQEVIAAKEQEKVRERPGDRGELARLRSQRAV